MIPQAVGKVYAERAVVVAAVVAGAVARSIPIPFTPRYLPTCLGVVLAVSLFAPSTALCDPARNNASDPSSDAAPESVQPVSLGDAREWLMHGDYERAAAAFTTLANAKETAGDAVIGLATCRIQTGAYDEAIDALTSHADASSAAWHYALAKAFRNVGRYDDVVHHARRAIELDANLAAPRRVLGETLELLGRRDDAINAYQWFERQIVERAGLKSDAAWLTDTAIGFVRYSVLTRNNVVQRLKHALRNMLQTAYGRVDRTYWPARIAAADLLRERYNNDPDDGSVSDYQAALRINPHLPQAQVGLGLVALDRWGFEEIEQRVSAALETNPNYAPAFHLRARKLILERRYDDAMVACEQALKINPHDVEALSLAAAAAACRLDPAQQATYAARVSAINPRSVWFYRIMGDALGGIRRYADSEQAYLRAIEYEPTDANARTELGMMYMQWGLEDKARDALDAAWALDPFNERTKFTLELLEMIEHFARYETDHFVIRFDAAADPGFGPYIAEYLEDLFDELTADYDTALTHKTEIEFFPTQRAFAVRITGKPWIHTVGACTGWVIALASPRESPQLMGPYNVATVLRHEFTHTVTLAATDNRIPHWFTEGLAVFQEDAPRPFEWCKLLADAIRHDRLFTLESIDWGFMRPKRPTDRTLAYAQSEWMVEYIIERFGYDVIQQLLRGYKSGKTQTALIKSVLKTNADQFENTFGDWARAQAIPWKLDLSTPEDVDALKTEAESTTTDARILARLAKAQQDAGAAKEAIETAKRALAIDENDPMALTVLVAGLDALSRQERNGEARNSVDDRAIPAINRLQDVDPTGWVGPKYLADIMLRRKEFDRALEALERLQRNLPIDPASWRGLAGIYLERGETDKALPQLIELARLVDGDADVRAKVASLYRRQGRFQDAQYWFRQALFIQPFKVALHQSLGDTCMQVNDATCALREYVMLTIIKPEQASYFESAALVAKKLGLNDKATEFARRAVELDPSSSARSLLP